MADSLEFEDIIPLDKLLRRYETDLKLALTYADTCNYAVDKAVRRKNLRKLSVLHYLRQYRDLLEKLSRTC